MATDYDAPRKTDEELAEDSLEELKARRADKAASAVDVDEAELAENLELPGADLDLAGPLYLGGQFGVLGVGLDLDGQETDRERGGDGGALPSPQATRPRQAKASRPASTGRNLHTNMYVNLFAIPWLARRKQKRNRPGTASSPAAARSSAATACRSVSSRASRRSRTSFPT